MFSEPPRTRFDLRFPLFGIPVRVHPMFWAISAALGLNLSLAELLVWIVVVLVSITVHEMGHALSLRLFHWRSHVVLYSLGGITIPASDVGSPPLRGWRQALVSACGPIAGFTLAAGAYVFIPLFASTTSGVAGAFYYHLIWINVVWGALNLLPVWPLDGGQVARSVLSEIAGDNGYALASMLSLVSAGAVAIVAWQMNRPLAALFFAYFAFLEWQR